MADILRKWHDKKAGALWEYKFLKFRLLITQKENLPEFASLYLRMGQLDPTNSKTHPRRIHVVYKSVTKFGLDMIVYEKKRKRIVLNVAITRNRTRVPRPQRGLPTRFSRFCGHKDLNNTIHQKYVSLCPAGQPRGDSAKTNSMATWTKLYQIV